MIPPSASNASGGSRESFVTREFMTGSEQINSYIYFFDFSCTNLILKHPQLIRSIKPNLFCSGIA